MNSTGSVIPVISDVAAPEDMSAFVSFFLVLAACAIAKAIAGMPNIIVIKKAAEKVAGCRVSIQNRVISPVTASPDAVS